MKLLIIAPYCAADKGGDGLGLFRWIQMIKDKMEVWFLSTYQTSDPGITHQFFYQSFPDTTLSKIKKIWNYYKTDYRAPALSAQPDIIQIHNPHFWALVRHFPNTPKILFEHNVHWNLLKYDMVHGPGFGRLPFKKLWFPWLLWRATKYEKKALNQAAHVFVYSNVDKSEILKKLPKLENKISVIPNSIDPAHYTATDSPGDSILFMGSLDYSANADAVDIICRELAPRLPYLPFKILGGGMHVESYPKNVEFLGFVSDILPYLGKTRVFIVPLRHGSGTRFKIVEALAMQRAVVSTPKGAEGLEVTHGLNIWIEQDWERFAEAIRHLWLHCDEGRILGKEGRKLVEEKYNYKRCCDLVIQTYRNIIDKTSALPNGLSK